MSEHPRPESVMVLHAGRRPESTLAITVDGKNLGFTITRRQLLGILAQAAEALRDMEPD